jgi:hypothetical protein
MIHTLYSALLLVLLTTPLLGRAEAPAAAPAAASAPAAMPRAGERSKNVSFEDSVVEGMNRNPLDSLEHIDKRDHSRKAHLYQRRSEFKKELKSAAQSTGYTP